MLGLKTLCAHVSELCRVHFVNRCRRNNLGVFDRCRRLETGRPQRKTVDIPRLKADAHVPGKDLVKTLNATTHRRGGPRMEYFMTKHTRDTTTKNRPKYAEVIEMLETMGGPIAKKEKCASRGTKNDGFVERSALILRLRSGTPGKWTSRPRERCWRVSWIPSLLSQFGRSLVEVSGVSSKRSTRSERSSTSSAHQSERSCPSKE